MVAWFTKLATPLAAVAAGVSCVRGERIPLAHGNAPQIANANATAAATTTSTGLASQTLLGHGMALATGADPLDRKGPIVADGSVEMIPSRVNMRCRFAFISKDHHFKLYRIFMASHGFRYDDWCESAERYIKAQCGAEVDEANVRWIRCDPEGEDLLWEKGYIATFELHVQEKDRPQCVNDVLPATVPGSVIDWMSGVGCYEAYGFEMEY